MAVSAARKTSIFNRLNEQPVKNKVCRFWLEGKCNRNPCVFLHRESPPLQTNQPPHLAPLDDSHRKQPRNLTWIKPNNHSKNGSPSNGEGGKLNGGSDRSTLAKALANTSKSGQKNQEASTAVISGPEKSSMQKVQPRQCKYWVNGNCVRGDKCKYLHSWFSGSGYTILAKLEGHAKAITGISLPLGSDKLYSGGKDGTIRAWDCNSGQCAGSVTIDGEVGCLVTEGPCLFAGIQNGIKVWNLQNHTEFSLNGPAGLVCSIVVDDDTLFAGMEDGTILVWKWHPETNIPELAAMLKEHTGAVCSLVIGAGRLYSSSRDSTIKVWDLQKLQCLQTLHGHARDVMSVLCWDRYLISASLDNTIKVWAATESGTIEVVYELKEDHEVIALCGKHDAEAKPILLCSFSDNTVRLYDLPSFIERGRIFSKRQVQVIETGVDRLFFMGDAAGDVAAWKLLGDSCETAS